MTRGLSRSRIDARGMPDPSTAMEGETYEVLFFAGVFELLRSAYDTMLERFDKEEA